jgi:phytanoyl-CoA hydroxylase
MVIDVSRGSKLRKQFDEQGYIIIKNFFAPELIAQARSELETLVDQQAEKLLKSGKVSHPYSNEPFETRLYRLYEGCLDEAPTIFRKELHLPSLFGYFFDSGLLDIVEQMLGGEVRLYPNYSVRPKLPEWEGTLVWWHQDGAYTKFWDHSDQPVETLDVENLRMLNVWSPLVPAREENGCMQFVPGTHRLGIVPHIKRQYYLEIVDEEFTRLFEQAVSIELDPGDMVFFSNLLFHQGLPNRSKMVRWNLDWRYQDATQPTLRREKGHIARSRKCPASAVRSREEWARLTFS